MCDVFVDLCTCRLDKKLPGRPEDIKPIISKTFNSRGQVDLIDMQTCPDGQFYVESGRTALQYDLHDALTDWENKPKVQSIRTALAAISMMGGQGHIHCSCTTLCDTARCTCKKANLLCNSRCHKSNTCCSNK